MGQIEGVVFDHGGVLTRGGGKGTNERVASAHMGLDSVIEVPDLTRQLKTGAIRNKDYVEAVNARFPHARHRLTMAMWDEIYADLTQDWMAYDLVSRCRAAGLRTAILSSINPTVGEWLRKDGSYDGFEPVVLSYACGLAKPDPRIYRLVEDQMRLRPQQLLFLDDQESCCAAARDQGWAAIRVDSSAQMVADVTAMLELPGTVRR